MREKEDEVITSRNGDPVKDGGDKLSTMDRVGSAGD